ncbi:MAG TPA: hypothetical protein VMT19_09070 [Thermoanaerobaculaceae bacterium]|nr:hypothetical protein [Thermoanaerobaculaceae bacterium]
MRPLPLVLLASFLAAAVGAADPPATPTPAPAAVVKRPLTLNLDHLLDTIPESGHAEFNSEARRDLWNDPMERLAIAVAREEAAARSGRGIAFPAPLAASNLLFTVPGPNPRFVLSGPWAADWADLTPQEKIGRIAEGAVYAGLILGILAGLR